MNKAQLIDAIAEKAGLIKADSKSSGSFRRNSW